jgi:hypothetical protein
VFRFFSTVIIESWEVAIFKSGAGGSAPAYGHPVVIEFLCIAFESFVYFAKYTGLQRNLLGRVRFLRKLRFGLIEHDTTERGWLKSYKKGFFQSGAIARQAGR